MRWFLLACVGVGCGSPEGTEESSPKGPKGACGEVSEHDLTLIGVVHVDGEPVEGADVGLSEELWHANGRVYKTAKTEADGSFELELRDVVSVEDCWGIALSYILYSEHGGLQASRGVNSQLFTAITNESGLADLSKVPLELY